MYDPISICTCRLTVVESIPDNLTYPEGSPSHPSTYHGWMSLLDSATTSIDIASFYWTLRGVDVYEDPSDWQVGTIICIYTEGGGIYC